MDGSERAVMLKRGPPWRSKEAGTPGWGVPPPPPGLQGGPSPAAVQVATRRLNSALASSPQTKKENPTFSKEVLGGATRR